MTTMKPFIQSVAALAFTCALAMPVHAGEILTNGGFENGFVGWSTSDQLGSDGTFSVQSGTSSPVNGDTVPAPPGGVNAAMTDGGAGGAHVLSQSFTVNAAAQYLLSFQIFIGNRAGLFRTPTPASLDWAQNFANQQVRVDLMDDSAAPDSVAGADILQNLYQSQAGDALVGDGYVTYSFDVTSLLNAHLGNTLRIRFAETDNLGPLQFGVDNVSLQTVPEPGSMLSMAGGLLGLAVFLRRRKG
jgi:hypothetical protein